MKQSHFFLTAFIAVFFISNLRSQEIEGQDIGWVWKIENEKTNIKIKTDVRHLFHMDYRSSPKYSLQVLQERIVPTYNKEEISQILERNFLMNKTIELSNKLLHENLVNEEIKKIMIDSCKKLENDSEPNCIFSIIMEFTDKRTLLPDDANFGPQVFVESFLNIYPEISNIYGGSDPRYLKVKNLNQVLKEKFKTISHIEITSNLESIRQEQTTPEYETILNSLKENLEKKMFLIKNELNSIPNQI